jgi:hypothetical protein
VFQLPFTRSNPDQSNPPSTSAFQIIRPSLTGYQIPLSEANYRDVLDAITSLGESKSGSQPLSGTPTDLPSGGAVPGPTHPGSEPLVGSSRDAPFGPGRAEVHQSGAADRGHRQAARHRLSLSTAHIRTSLQSRQSGVNAWTQTTHNSSQGTRPILRAE